MDFSKPPKIDVNALFGGSLQHVPGFGYVSGGGTSAGPLGDEASVMMISGPGDVEGRVMSAAVDRGGQTLRSVLTQPVTIGALTQPLWVWLLGALGVTGLAGWYFFVKRK